ncbi:hypothetical protein [Thermocoleostomius sinensis]|uniref:Uncharacterized protein n=1 Tax=Thermocoleostomius sinensis A174 TaxID=2016057 RepID=A0A9E8ZPT0_9CYAN|nr:hypothetical protein [Thermocoleostomius sinensis]WAL62771.1 hypothetical protein OXH18_12490 [Thermocoleostomius sinensis A174]
MKFPDPTECYRRLSVNVTVDETLLQKQTLTVDCQDVLIEESSGSTLNQRQ